METIFSRARVMDSRRLLLQEAGKPPQGATPGERIHGQKYAGIRSVGTSAVGI
jgi:hypothetical protein